MRLIGLAALIMAVTIPVAVGGFAPPVPAPFPGVDLGNGVLLRIGPGVAVDEGGIRVNCDVDEAAVNVIIDGRGSLIPVTCGE